MDWSRQGGAVVSPARLSDGRAARIVLVSDRSNPKGAMVVLPDAPNDQNAFPLGKFLVAIAPYELTEILCMQERAFGQSALKAPDLS